LRGVCGCDFSLKRVQEDCGGRKRFLLVVIARRDGGFCLNHPRRKCEPSPLLRKRGRCGEGEDITHLF